MYNLKKKHMGKSLQLTIILLIFTSLSFGQIGIVEDFNAGLGIPPAWTSQGFAGTNQAPCDGNSIRQNLYGGSTTGEFMSINYAAASNATDLNVSFDYKIVDFGVAPPFNPTVAGWGSITVSYTIDNGSTWVDAFVVDDANHVVSANCATMNFLVPAADLPNGSDFQLRFQTLRTAGDYYAYLDNISAVQTSTSVPNCDALLNAPSDGAVDVAIDGNISWFGASGLPTGYTLTVGTTPGGNDVANGVDVGNSLSAALGALSYDTTYYVTIVPYNANGAATGCSEYSFTTTQDPNATQIVDCASGIPLTGTYCYVANDTQVFSFQSSDGSPLNLTFTQGQVENGWDSLIVFDSDGTTNINAGAPFGNAGDISGLSFQSSGTQILFTIQSDGIFSCDDQGYTNISFEVSCATCANPQATYTTREDDCANGNQFFVDVDVTSLGSANSLTVADDQGSTSQTVTATGIIEMGPYAIGTAVEISIDNDDDANCTISQGDLTVEASTCPIIVDCASGAVNTTYCYTNNDTTQFIFESSDGVTPLNVVFNAGGTENNFDEVLVFDSDGVTDLNAATPYGNSGDLTGLFYQSTGTSIIIQIQSDGSVNGCTGNLVEWDFDVFCATCTMPEATYTAREDDCANGQQFLIDVDVTSLGSAASLTVSDDQGSATQAAVANGILTFGPYTIGTLVEIEVASDDDTNCVISQGNLTIDASTCPLIVDCSAGAVNTTYCYTGNDTTQFIFESNDGSPLNVTFNAGQTEDGWDDVLILDSDGITDLNAATPYGNAGDLTGLTYQSTGASITVQIQSDGFFSCDGGGLTPWDFDITCATCTFQTVEYTTREDDCINGQQYFVDVNITDLGSAVSIDVTDDQGSAAQNTTVTGIVSFGPYAIGTPVVITTANADDTNCIIVSDPIVLTQSTCPFIVDCDTTPYVTTHCYEDDDTLRFYYESDNGSQLRIVFTEGYIHAVGFGADDNLIIYDSDDVTELYNGNGSAGNLTGIEFISTGDRISWTIQSDGFVSCEDNFYTPARAEVYCYACTNPTVDFTVNGNCSNDPAMPSEFTVDIDVSDFGSAAFITVSEDYGFTPQNLNTPGIVTFGPYPANVPVNFTVENTNDNNCNVYSGPQTLICVPLPNDCSIIYGGEDLSMECSNAGVELSASYMVFGQDTTEYIVNELSGCPLLPLTGGNPTGIDADDTWSPVIDMTFDFCFFGNTYNQIVVDANGAVSFDIANATTGSGWQIDPADLLPTPNLHTNAIFGAYHDMNPNDGEYQAGSMEYIIIGDAPYRQFVVNFYDVEQFGGGCNGVRTTQQIILYESSNNIDVNVFDKPSCDQWNGGLAVIGVQNEFGTEAFFPPGRNTGVFDITNESYRFSPGGADSFTVQWLDENGAAVGTGDTVTVNPTQDTTYTVEITYDLCNGSSETLTDEVDVFVGAIPVDELNDVASCESYTLIPINEGTYYEQSGGPNTAGNVMYNIGDAITASQTVYIYNGSTTDPSCFSESNFFVVINTRPLADTFTDIETCDTFYQLPALSSSEQAYYTATDGPNGAGVILNAGDQILADQTIYVFAVNPSDPICFDETSFTVSFVTEPLVDIRTDVEACGNYTLPTVTDGTYYSQPNGIGPLAVGDVLTTNQTVYIYNGTPTCFNESSFDVTVYSQPTADILSDVTACENYTLPVLTVGDYYSGTGGSGTLYSAGDIISSDQTLYIYASNGPATINCNDESQFTVSIVTQPIVDVLANETFCENVTSSYTLPVLTVGDYYTGTGGTGVMMLAGDVISTSQTIYIFADNAGAVNCSDESSFTITFNEAPSISSVDDVFACARFDGTAEFDTTGINEGLINGQTDVSIIYEDLGAGVTLSTPLPNPFFTGETTIRATITNDNTGCFETVDFALSYSPVTDCDPIIPEGFSPDGDGVNDEFVVTNLKERFPNFTMEFYNRWGKEVYKATVASPNWNGEMDGDGELVPVGVYYYIINYNNEDREPVQGRLYLSR